MLSNGNAQNAYLAFDLGAESGRAVIGRLNGGILKIDEIHRFLNEPVRCGNSLHWDVPRLWLEIRKGLNNVGHQKLGGIGVDTWGVDLALLGENGELLQNPYHYRDERTAGIMKQVFDLVPADEIYEQTGIQFMPINTLYQLFASQRRMPRLLAAADRLITIPDLFNYWLTGNAVCEFTNATTTQMVDPRTRTWAKGMLERLGLPSSLPGPIVEPGTVIGNLLPGVGVKEHSGTPVIAPASHDTGSAVASIAARGNAAFISSGTWSLLGIEIDKPVINAEARRLNFTNEGGVCGTTRFLKNVMGLWMLQSCRHCWSANGQQHEYQDLMKAAAREPGFRHLVNPDDPSFLKPEDMQAAIDQFCRRTDQPAPKGPGAYARTILESLALKYRLVLRDLEYLTGNKVEQIRIIGGGSRNELLNQFTADATGRQVVAGPVEATALGNIGIQMLATGAASSLHEVRQIIDRSFPTVSFEPSNPSRWDEESKRFQQYCEFTYA
jgi:rhamnulokinase